MPRPKKTMLSIPDMSGVETFRLCPEGTYLAKVKAVEAGKSSAGKPTLIWDFTVISDDNDANGCNLKFWTSLQPQALFKLRGLLEVLDVEIPGKAFKLDPKDLIGRECGVIVVHDQKDDGKVYSTMEDYLSASMVEGMAAKNSGEEEPESEEEPEDGEATLVTEGDEDKYEDDEVMDMDADELAEIVEKHGLDVDLSKAPTLRKKRNVVFDALEEMDLIKDD